MTMLRTALLATVATVALAAGSAQATVTISAGVGGVPNGSGIERFNFNDLTLGTVPASQNTTGTLGTSIEVAITPDAAVVQGSLNNFYAAPVLSNNQGAGFGSPDQPNGIDSTIYLTSGKESTNVNTAKITLNLGFAAQYIGLLWGSVDSYNTLSLYSGGSLVGTVTGSQVSGFPNGNQGPNGTYYVNIDSSVSFDSVVFTSTQYAFEFDNVALSRTTQIPEPMSIALLGAGLLGLGIARSRRRA